MMKIINPNKLCLLLLALAFLLYAAVPVIANGFNHQAVYELEGRVDFKQQLGHLCNTGAERKMTISGDGEISKTTTTVMAPSILSVEDNQEWVTAEDALSNLTVTSVIEVCAPPKTEFTTTYYEPNTEP